MSDLYPYFDVGMKFPIVHLGNFEYSDSGPVYQNNLHVKRNLEWLVIDHNDVNHSILLLSKEIVDTMGFADCPIFGSGYKSSWYDSYIRKWLNEDFINEAFSPEERSIISTTQISPEKRGQKKTLDRLFLLSESEYLKYFPNKDGYVSYCYVDDFSGVVNISKEPWFWWLRSNGEYDSEIRVVDKNGMVDSFDSNSDETGVRPAMWIKHEEVYLALKTFWKQLV